MAGLRFAAGWRTSIAQPRSSRSPSQLGHPVHESIARPRARLAATRAWGGSGGTGGGAGVSLIGRPRGVVKWRVPFRSRSSW
jgi:hypothetical protein